MISYVFQREKSSTYSKDDLEMRSGRASSGISELFKDTGVQSCKSNVVDNVVGNKPSLVRLPLRDSGADLCRIAEDVVKTQIALYAKDIGQKGVVLKIPSDLRVVDENWDVQRFQVSR